MEANYTRANDYQMRQMLKKLSGCSQVMNEHALPGWQDVLSHLVGADLLRLPFDLDQAYLIYERLPVLGQLAGVPARSSVGRIVMDRPEDTGIFVDGFLSGGGAIYCVAWMQIADQPNLWMQNMSRMELYAKPMGAGLEGSMVLAPLKSFLHLSQDE